MGLVFSDSPAPIFFETRMSKEAIITSSRLNCYGTRVLTEGVDTEQYEKNPILLYMHRRGSRSDMPIGVIENLRREGDFIYGTPKFDELTEEEKIIAAKWENGTLRMLSAGLEIIEWSEDEKYLVQGQTRPTVVRSKLTEVSVVDIGGNDDALQTVRLYQGNKVLTLAKDEECEHLPLLKLNTPTSADEEGAGKHSNNIQNTFQMNEILQLLGVATENDALAAIKALQEQNAALNLARITDAVDAAVAEKRITADKKEHFISLGKQSGVETLRTTLSMFAPAQKPTDVINANGKQTVALKWGDYDAAQLEALRKENREEYIRLFKEHYGYTPNIQ